MRCRSEFVATAWSVAFRQAQYDSAPPLPAESRRSVAYKLRRRLKTSNNDISCGFRQYNSSDNAVSVRATQLEGICVLKAKRSNVEGGEGRLETPFQASDLEPLDWMSSSGRNSKRKTCSYVVVRCDGVLWSLSGAILKADVVSPLGTQQVGDARGLA
jgi:hypothetical protein